MTLDFRIHRKPLKDSKMKKAFAVIVLICVCFVTVYSENGDLKKQTYFRIGYSIPTWKYFGNNGKSDWSLEARRVGGIFEVGNIFMLNSLKLAPGMRIGINLDYLSINYHRFYSNELYSGSENLLFAGSKIGPSFSYSPIQRLVVDAYVKFNPVWVSGSMTAASELGDDQYYLGFLGIKYSFGLNIRYAILMTGIEINPGFVRMKLFDEEDSKFTEIYKGNANDNSNRTPVPGINFTVGLSF